MHSSSRVTCSRRTAATVCGKLMMAPVVPGPERATKPLDGSMRRRAKPSLLLRGDRSLLYDQAIMPTTLAATSRVSEVSGPEKRNPYFGATSRIAPTSHHSPLTTHHSPLTTHHSPLTTHAIVGLRRSLARLHPPTYTHPLASAAMCSTSNRAEQRV